MITEIRNIIFSNEALGDALFVMSKALKRPWPPGYIKSVEVVEENGVQVVLNVYDPKNDHTVRVTFKEAEIAAALIRYCRLHQIPLPKSANKSITTYGDNLSFLIERRVKRTPLHDLLGKKAA